MRLSTVFSSAMALAGAAISVSLFLELRAERLLNAELNARIGRVTSTSAASPSPTPAPVLAASIQTRASSAPPSANSTVSQPARGIPMTGDEWMEQQRQLLNDPRYREAWYEQQRLQMTSRRERIKDVLKLSDEQANAVIDLSIDRMLTWQFQSPPEPMTDEYQREQAARSEAADRTEKAGLRAVLGEAKYARYLEYLESGPSRQQVERLRSELSGPDALRDDQVEPLIAAMHAEQAQLMNEMQTYRETVIGDSDDSASMEKFAEHMTGEMKATHARIRTAAGAILSDSQLKQLVAMLKRDLAAQEAQVRMQRIQSKLYEPPDARNSN